MNKIQTSMLAICVILAIIGISMWNMPNIEHLNEITNNTVNQSNVIPLEKPPFLNENTP